MLGVSVVLVSQRIQAGGTGKSGLSKNLRKKYGRRSVCISLKETSFLKSGNKYKTHWQAEYHHTLKRNSSDLRQGSPH